VSVAEWDEIHSTSPLKLIILALRRGASHLWCDADR